jgi:hypothetical protein
MTCLKGNNAKTQSCKVAKKVLHFAGTANIPSGERAAGGDSALRLCVFAVLSRNIAACCEDLLLGNQETNPESFRGWLPYEVVFGCGESRAAPWRCMLP